MEKFESNNFNTILLAKKEELFTRLDHLSADNALKEFLKKRFSASGGRSFSFDQFGAFLVMRIDDYISSRKLSDQEFIAVIEVIVPLVDSLTGRDYPQELRENISSEVREAVLDRNRGRIKN